MTTTFMRSPSYLFTSESVTEGHPDKLCDQVSDAVLDAIFAEDPLGRVACETLTTTGLVVVTGEITTTTYVDIPRVVRETVRQIGYTNAEYGFDCDTCGVLTAINEQSPDIARGVEAALEVRGDHGSDEFDRVGAGDQGMMYGFACEETPDLMPLPISLAHSLTRRLALVRKQGVLPYLRPDGKSQVTVEYAYGVPKRVENIVIAAQHDPAVDRREMEADIREHVIAQVIPTPMVDRDTKIYVNATGRFVIGGPKGDAGLTGRKILVDTYGGMARHGGGAFSGKDPTKVDRSAAYMCRYVAKNLVAAGLAERLELHVAYVIGKARPLAVSVETFGTAKVDDARILELIHSHFDLRPAAIIRHLDLRRPIYRQTAAYGHFGRPDLDLPWEHTDKAQALRRDAGLD